MLCMLFACCSASLREQAGLHTSHLHSMHAFVPALPWQPLVRNVSHGNLWHRTNRRAHSKADESGDHVSKSGCYSRARAMPRAQKPPAAASMKARCTLPLGGCA